MRTSTRAPVLVFGLLLASIYGAAWWIVARLGQLDDAGLIAAALTVDLTVVVPVLYYLLMVRRRGWPHLTVLPVFLISVVVAGLLIPESRHRVLDLIEYAAVLVELAIVAVIVHKALQVRRGYREKAAAGMDVYESLRDSAISVLGRAAGGVVAYETAVFYYAFTGWGKPAGTDEKAFTIHRNTGYAALLIAVTIVLFVETLGVHMLVRLWSPAAAWIFTALSLYALVWIAGDYHAVRLRPVEVSGDLLRLRVGLRWNAAIPKETIRVTGVPAGEAGGRPQHVKAVLIGAPNRRLELSEPIRLTGLYGFSRRARTIDLQVDEPARFDAALKRSG